jgi:hypothetical protein
MPCKARENRATELDSTAREVSILLTMPDWRRTMYRPRLDTLYTVHYLRLLLSLQ